MIHQVEPGETLYSLSRRYNATVADITNANKGISSGLSVGQEVSIPWSGSMATKEEETAAQYHTVEAGQTLYAISRKYNVTVDEMKQWNKLTSNELSTGQQLIVSQGKARESKNTPEPKKTEVTASDIYHEVGPSETLYSISRKYNASVEDLKAWNGLKESSLSVGQRLVVGRPTAQVTPVANEVEVIREKKKDLVVNENGSLQQINEKGYTSETVADGDYEKIVEEGFAMVIENSPDTRKFLALHRTAPIGAILEVKNRMNGRSIYVRVVGKLPDTGVNNKVLIRLSDKAYQRLEALDPKIPVEVSYVP